LRVGAVGVLGPEAVEDEGGAAGALGGVRVGVAKLRRPGEVEEVVVERLAGACLDGEGGGGGVWARGGLGRRLRWRRAAGEDEKNEETGNGFLLHGGRRIARVSEVRQRGWLD